MEEKSRYEEMYGKLVAYEQNIHLQNQKRIKIGLKCIADRKSTRLNSSHRT